MTQFNRRDLIKFGTALGIAAAVPGTRFTGVIAAEDVWAGEPDPERVKEQAAELFTYGMPADWANYGAVYKAFTDSLGIELKHTDTDMSSLEEITKFDAEKANPIAMFADIGMLWGPVASAKGVVPNYLPPSAADLPEGYKGKDGGWVATYAGVPALVINKAAIAEQGLSTPATWADLLKPEFKGKIGSPGDPMASGTAQTTVLAWAYANGGDANNLGAAADYAKAIVQQYNTASSSIDLLEKGEIIAWIRYDFNCSAAAKALTDKQIDAAVVIPGISIYAPSALMANKYNEKNADVIKAFMEFVLSDAAAEAFAAFGARPIRYVLGKQTLSDEAKKNWLPEEDYKDVKVIEDFTQIDAEKIAKFWEDEVLEG